jgi:calcium-dependent protein kinase
VARADACHIVREILRTVSQFHANSVVIRDVKPENFLFAEEGLDSHLKAIDFGIAQYCRYAPAWLLLQATHEASLCD